MKVLNSNFVKTKSRWHSRRRGQNLVEAALVMVFAFVPLLVGMLQFGVYLNTTNALWNLAREGARVASVQSSGSTKANQNVIDTIKQRTPPNLDTQKMTITITPDTASSRTSKTQVTVTLAYDMSSKIFLPLPGGVLPRSYVTYASMMVEGN